MTGVNEDDPEYIAHTVLHDCATSIALFLIQECQGDHDQAIAMAERGAAMDDGDLWGFVVSEIQIQRHIGGDVEI